jgi:hypothetical protein
MDILDPKQLEELQRLNQALKNNNVKPEDKKALNRKLFNPQTGELQLFSDDGKGGVKLSSINLFGD